MLLSLRRSDKRPTGMSSSSAGYSSNMSAHDDYFDVEDAFKRYDRAYVSWGRAADSDERSSPDPKVRAAAEHKAQRRARTYVAACAYLAQQAAKAAKSMGRRGWESRTERKRNAT